MRDTSYFSTSIRWLVPAVAILALVIAGQVAAESLHVVIGSQPSDDSEFLNLVTSEYSHLEYSYTATCSEGSALSDIQFRWIGLEPQAVASPTLTLPLETTPTPGAELGIGTVALTPSNLRELCKAVAPRKKQQVTGRIVPFGICGGERTTGCPQIGDGTYTLSFDLDCTGGDGSENLKGPTHTSDTGPPEQSLEGALTFAEGDFGGSLSGLFSFGSCDQHTLKVSGESLMTETTSDGTVMGDDLPGLGSGDLSLFPAHAGVFPGEPIRLDLDFTFVDVSYLYSLAPKTRRTVPEISAGIGWAFVDAERSGGFDLPSTGDPFEGLDEDSLTLNAGLRLRINVGKQAKRYLFFGLQSRWFAVRERDEFETSIVVGVGLGIPSSRRPPRRSVDPPYELPTKNQPAKDSEAR